MRALRRKSIREMVRHRGQFTAIGLVVACGVASYVAMRSAYDSLEGSRGEYYREYRLADVFAHLKRAPESAASTFPAIDGVGGVETRVVVEVTLHVEGFGEPIDGRIVSIPDRGAPALNALHLVRGRFPEPDRPDEVLVSKSLAGAHGLLPGESISAVLNGRWERLRVVGIAISPEYVYEIGGGTMVFPDPERFGVLWMRRDSIAPVFDMEGAFNDVAIALVAGADEDAVIDEVDRRLERYGGLGAYGREDLLSNRFLSDEIRNLRASGRIIPGVFLAVAAFLLHMVFGRLIRSQRDQIAILKAFGYGNGTIGLSYFQTLIVVVVLGGLLGTAVGMILGWRLTVLYTEFFRFPILAYRARPIVPLTAIAASLAAASLGAFTSIRQAIRLPPAEAMRPEPPARFRPTFLERVGLSELVRPAARIFLRNVERKPIASALSVVGIALAVALLLVGRFFVDTTTRVAVIQFENVQREDVTVTFTEPRSSRVLHEVAELPGVLAAEPFRAAAVRVRSDWRSYRTTIFGLESGADLRRLVDEDLGVAPLPPDGVVLTAHLAEMLGLAAGDEVVVEVLEGRRPVGRFEIVGLVDEVIGANSYMELAALNRFLGERPTHSGAFLRVDPLAEEAFGRELEDKPAIQGSSWRRAARRSYEETLARSMGIFTTIMVTFACVIAFAVVYNGARISLSERGRELATLRVLGFSRGEVALVLLGEQAVLILAGIPLGYAIGVAFSAYLVRTLETDLFRMPLDVQPFSYAFAAGIVILASIASSLIVRRRIHRLDLVEVLKTRE